MRIYLDTCIYCRPFDDQSQKKIAKETTAFIRILELAESEKISIVNSDILMYEIEEIEQSSILKEVRRFVGICKDYVDLSKEIIKFAKKLEKECNITGADALHLASACTNSEYFITCDKFLLKRSDCIERFVKERGYILKIENPIHYVEAENGSEN